MSINIGKSTKTSNNYKSASHHKYLCNYHIILVCKYRKKLLQGKVNDDVSQLVFDYCNRYEITIKAIQSDINHLHILIDCSTKVEPHKFISHLKQFTTFHIWKMQKEVLEKHFWREKTFWGDGYFCCTVGNASIDKIKEYIDNQG